MNLTRDGIGNGSPDCPYGWTPESHSASTPLASRWRPAPVKWCIIESMPFLNWMLGGITLLAVWVSILELGFEGSHAVVWGRGSRFPCLPYLFVDARVCSNLVVDANIITPLPAQHADSQYGDWYFPGSSTPVGGFSRHIWKEEKGSGALVE